MIMVNKPQWKTYKFGDIASNISERAEPKMSNLDIYVGLEHLDPDCVHIKRKGHPSDVKGIKLRVYPGDIIFGKRRAYQRKAAIVDFDGICSAHAMVVRANHKVILPELLPYFMHSDAFMHRAVDVSEGSLSPTIKWKILAEQQFKLPSLDDQKRIADLLWSVDECKERQILAYDKLFLLVKSFVKNIFKSSKEGIALKKIVTSDSLDVEKALEGEMPYVEIGDIDISNKSINLKDKAAVSGSKYAKSRDIIISKVRPTRGAIAIVNLEKVAISNAFTIVRANEDFNQELLFFLLAYNDQFLNYLGERSTGSTYPTVADEDIFSYKTPIIGKGDQEKMLSRFVIFKKSIDLFKSNIEKNNKIQKEIINRIFE